MTIGEMIKRADKAYKNEKDTLRERASNLWMDLQSQGLRKEDLGDVADLFIFGCAIFNSDWVKGSEWMRIAKEMSEEIVEDPAEFHDITVRHINDKLNETLGNK